MAMTREQARAAAIKLRAMKPELQAMNLDTLIAKIMVNEGNANVGEAVMTPGGMSRETAFEGLPQSAIASALMLTPPQTVTPATPAPMKPGVALVAPKPTAPAVGGPLELPEDVRQSAAVEAAPVAAPQVPEERLTAETVAGAPKEGVRPSRYRRLLDETVSELNNREALMQQARDQGVDVPITEQARIRALTQRANMLKGYVQAEEAAEIPEEFQSALASQEQRLQRREERLAEAKRLSPWEALLAGSAAMAQGRGGERFGEALSRGLQTGLRAYAQAKNENEEGIEGVGEARDAAVLKRYELIQKARDDAVGMIKSGMTMDKDIAELSKIDDETALRTALLEPTITKGKAEARIKEVEAEFAPQIAQAELSASLALGEARRAQAAAAGLNKTGGNTRGVTGVFTALTTSNTNLDKILSNPLVTDPAIKKEARAQKTANNLILRNLSVQMGLMPPPAAPKKKPAGRILSSEPIKK